MSEWFETLPGIHNQVWHQLVQGVSNRDAAARQPTLATISPDGWPEARTVVLRRADRAAAQIEVYTDNQSDKMAGLAAQPRAALHFWDATLALQVRMQAEVTVSNDQAVAHRWGTLSDFARLSYGVEPSPGTAIPAALNYGKNPEQSRFCVLQLTLTHIDALHLGDDHRRARFTAGNAWAGAWLVP